jgi:hypothetical protein
MGFRVHDDLDHDSWDWSRELLNHRCTRFWEYGGKWHGSWLQWLEEAVNICVNKMTIKLET